MKITREELQAIENHIGNIPHVGAMYAPVLIAWCRALLDEQDAAYDERDELLVRVADQSAELRATRETYRDAYRRGAEAMREAWCRMRALPIPEEP